MKTKLLSGEIPLDFKIFGGFKMVLSKLIKEYKEMCLEDVPVEKILEDLQKLEGIYKPEDAPKFVADWYEKNKDDFEYRVWECIYHDGEGKQTEMSEWICQNENAIITLVNMHQFGYMVEKEKRYLVKMKNLRALFCYLGYIPDEGYWTLMASGGKSTVIKHTRKELEEAGFGEVFDSPLFEVEEVEE